MSKNSDELKRIQAQLDEIAKKYQELGKSGENPFENMDAQKVVDQFKDADKAAEALNNTLFTVNDRLDALNNSTDDLVQQMKAVVREIDNSQKPLNQMNKAYKGLIGAAQNLADESDRSTSMNSKDLAKLKDKAIIQAKYARANADALAKELTIKKFTKGLSDKEEAQLKSSLGILNDTDGTQRAVLDKIDARIKLEDEYNRKLGFGGKLAEGLDKALQKAGFPALGIADAIEKAKKNFIDSNGETRLLTDVAKELKDNLKESASFANLSQLAFVALFKAMKDVDKASGEFAKNQGISYEDTLALRDEMNKVAITSGDILVTSQALMETQASLNEFFGTSVKFTGEMADDFAQLTKRTKMTAETQGLIALETMKTGKSAMQLTKELNTQTFELNAQKGVQMSVKQIQDAIGKTAASLQLTFKGSSKELANQVVSARALGTTLQGVEQISKSLLEFESSIQAELEAELLLGKEINLERARAAALQGDLATVAEEVMENQAVMEAFNTKNVIAQEAAAKSLGMSREDLANMVLEQQKLETIRAFGAENLNAAQEKYNKLREQGLTAEQAAAEVGDESLANQLQSASVAERFEAIMLRVQEIFIALGEPILGVVDGMISIAGSAENFAKILGVIAGIYAGIKTFNALDAVMQKRKERAKQKELAQETAIATANTISNPIAAIAALAVAAIVAGTILGSMSDGMIGPDGGMIVSGPKGSIQLDKEDSIIAGTDLIGEKSGKKERGGGARRDEALISEIRTLIGVNRQILAKSSVIEMNGNQVGQEINQSERAIQ